MCATVRLMQAPSNMEESGMNAEMEPGGTAPKKNRAVVVVSKRQTAVTRADLMEKHD